MIRPLLLAMLPALSVLLAPSPAAAQSTPPFGRSGLSATGQHVMTEADFGAALATKADSTRLDATAGLVINARARGMKCDNATDDAPALAAMVNSITPGNAARVQLPPGTCVLATMATLTSPALIVGHGGGPEGTPGTNGTWLRMTQPGAGITFSGAGVRGAAVRDLGVMQDQPVPAAGWAPTPYGPAFSVLNTYGSVEFDRVMFAGVNRGILASNSGRLHIGTIFGQFYTAGIEMDAMYDVVRLDHVHCWPFTSQAGPVLDYSTAHADCVLSRRVDGLEIGDLFAFGMQAGLHLDSSTLGATHPFQVSNLYADFSKFGLWASGTDTAGQVSNMVSTHALFSALPAVVHIPGSAGVRVDGSNTFIGVNQLRAGNAQSSGVQVAGSNNHIGIDQAWIEGWNFLNDGSGAIAAYDGGVAGPNIVQLGAPPILTEGAGPTTSMVGASVLTRAMQMNLLNNATNEPRAFNSPAGTGVSLGATGGDASIDFNITAKGPAGSVKLNAANGPVLRLDNPNGVGNTNMLIRSSPIGVSIIPETVGPNASVSLYAKGAGAVIIGAPYTLTAPAGVCLTADCAMQVQASPDGTRMMLLVGGAARASLDVMGTLRVSGAVLSNTAP